MVLSMMFEARNGSNEVEPGPAWEWDSALQDIIVSHLMCPPVVDSQNICREGQTAF